MSGSVRVVLHDPTGTAVAAEATVQPPYLIPLELVDVVSTSSNTIDLNLRPERGVARVDEDGEPLPDVPVGAIPLLSRDHATGEFTVVELSLPAPPAFSRAGIDEMWQSVCSLPGPVPASIRRQGLWSALTAGTWSPDDVFMVTLPALLEEARHLVHHWPHREAVDSYWRPVELPGGREDIVRTVRASHVPVAAIGERPLPTRTLRWRAATEPWTLETIEVLAREVARRVRGRRVAENGIEEMLAPLAGVEALARPRERRPDPPPSSWPWPLRRFHDGALDVLLEVTAAGAGGERAPLCHLWRLYEGWVAKELYEYLCASVGAPTIEPTLTGTNSMERATWFARWDVAGTITELWAQPEITNQAFPLCNDDPGLTLVSVTSALVPDALVAIRPPGGEPTLVVFDAKHTGERQMNPGEVTKAASKYLWGIRQASDLAAAGALRRVVLVSSGPPRKVFDTDNACIHGLSAVPITTPLRSRPELPGLF